MVVQLKWTEKIRQFMVAQLNLKWADYLDGLYLCVRK